MHKTLDQRNYGGTLCQVDRESGIPRAGDERTMQVILDAHPRYLIATDVVAFVLAAALVLLVSRIPMLLSGLACTLLIALLALGFGLDVLRWWRQGIRSVELDDSTLTVLRGPWLAARRIERRQVTGLRIPWRPGRRAAILRVSHGRRLVITEDAFPREAFARFLTALDAWR